MIAPDETFECTFYRKITHLCLKKDLTRQISEKLRKKQVIFEKL